MIIGQALIADNQLSALIEEGRKNKAPVVEDEEAPEQTAKTLSRQDSGLIGWYNAQTQTDTYLQGRGYKPEGDDRMSSPYSKTGRDVRLLANGKGVLCAYLHSGSHPLAQWLGLDGEALSSHLIDPFEFRVFYEHSDNGTIPYKAAFQSALTDVRKQRTDELLREQVGERHASVDVTTIPQADLLVKEKWHYSGPLICQLLGLPSHLKEPDDDTANAYRIARSEAETLCYTPERGWGAYDGRIWRFQGAGRVLATACAQQVAALIDREVSRLYAIAIALNEAGRDNDRSAVLAAAERMIQARGKRGIGSYRRKEDALKEAQPLLLTPIERFRRKPFVLAFPNTVWDHGHLRPHRPDDYFTDLLPVEYDPHADQTDWLKACTRITGKDDEYADNLQYLCGYVLSGQSSRRLLPFLYGAGGTGKSTLAEALCTVLGDLAAVVDPHHLSRRGERERLGAVLYNRNLVVCTEAGNSRIEAEVMKTLSGGDRIAVRNLYERPFTAEPTHVLMMVTNDPPRMDAYDEALWDRIVTLPFIHPLARDGHNDLLDGKRIEEVRRDRTSALIRGFLAWAMVGLERVMNGEEFVPCDTVYLATLNLRRDTDPLKDFWLSLSTVRDEGFIMTEQLSQEYRAWCASTGQKQLAGKAWSKACRAVGLVRDEVRHLWRLDNPAIFPH